MGEVIEAEFELVGNLSTQERYGLPSAPKEGVRTATQRAKARLGFALADVCGMKANDISKWLDQVAERNPAEAVRLFMELTEFIQPRLKAANIVANLTPTEEGKSRLREMSIEQLEQLSSGNGE